MRDARGWSGAMRWQLMALAMMTAAGCGSAIYATAETELELGHYLRAAELYDQQLGDHPDDAAKAARDKARRAALRDILTEVTAQRTTGDRAAAIKQLGQFFVLREAWGTTPEPATTAALPAEVTAVGEYIEAAILDRMRTVGLASADALARTFDPLLRQRELAPWRDDLRARLSERGKSMCQNYSSEVTTLTPFLRWAVAAYCMRWGYNDVVVPPLPDLRANLVVDGAVDGETGDDLTRLRATLAAAFRASAWFAPDTTADVHATIAGRIAVTSQTQVVARSAPWYDSYSYPVDETVPVATQEPYQETVTRSVNRDGAVEEHSRTVTKYRTVEHLETQQVMLNAVRTNLFNYQESELTGNYVGTINLRLGAELGGITVSLDDRDVRHGLERNASSQEANVHPEHRPLMTLPQFATQEEARLAEKLRRALDEQYAKQFCIDPSALSWKAYQELEQRSHLAPSPLKQEYAARCAYLDPARLSSDAHRALAEIFGKDEPEAVKLLKRPNRP